ncbi:MAG: hypothetical protein JSS44_02155 [Proteobacteria bacterium]|nr:hypothetical protein [Pseudomonadota bacterium]
MLSLRTTLSSALAAIVFALALTGTANAADRHVKIINATRHTIVRFYASRTSTNSWEEDILGSSTLDPGEAARINIDDGSGSCVYDFKAVFNDGTALVRREVNVCEIESYTYTED